MHGRGRANRPQQVGEADPLRRTADPGARRVVLRAAVGRRRRADGTRIRGAQDRCRTLRWLVGPCLVMGVGALLVGCSPDRQEDVAACERLAEIRPVDAAPAASLSNADIVFALAQRGEDFEPTPLVVLQRDGSVFVERNGALVRVAISASDTRRAADCVASPAFSQLADAYNLRAAPEAAAALGRPGTMIARGPVAGDEKVVFVISDCQDPDAGCFRSLPQPVRSLIELGQSLERAGRSRGEVVGRAPRSPDLGVGFPSG